MRRSLWMAPLFYAEQLILQNLSSQFERAIIRPFDLSDEIHIRVQRIFGINEPVVLPT